MKSWSFKTQILVYGGGLMLFIAFLLLLLFGYRVNSFLREELILSGEYLVTDLASASELGVSAEDPILSKPFVDAFFKREDIILTALYNQRGLLFFYREEPGVVKEGVMDYQRREKLENERNVLRLDAKTEDGEFVYEFYAPVISSYTDRVIGFSKITLSLGRVNERVKQMMIHALLITLFVVVMGTIFLFLLAQGLTKPLVTLKEGVDIIRKGNLDHRVEVKGGGEIKEVSKAFNKMAEELEQLLIELEEAKGALEVKVQSKTKALRELNESLEERFKKRTKEVQKRLEELEKFRKTTVGREMKMIELKKENEKLEEELKRIKEEE